MPDHTNQKNLQVFIKIVMLNSMILLLSQTT